MEPRGIFSCILWIQSRLASKVTRMFRQSIPSYRPHILLFCDKKEYGEVYMEVGFLLFLDPFLAQSYFSEHMSIVRGI